MELISVDKKSQPLLLVADFFISLQIAHLPFTIHQPYSLHLRLNNYIVEKARLLYCQKVFNHFFLFAHSVFGDSDSD